MNASIRIALAVIFGFAFASAIAIPEATAPVMMACSLFCRLLLKLCGAPELVALIGGPLLAYFGLAVGSAMALNATLGFTSRPALVLARA